MDIEIRERKTILPVETVFDLDRNAAVWTFVLPETVENRKVTELTGRLAVKTNARQEAVRIPATREGTRFTVQLPAGLFTQASAAEVQFSLCGEDFAWYTEIERVNVVRCLDPAGDAAALVPNLMDELENAQKATATLVDQLLTGETAAGRATADAEGRKIQETYATKEDMRILGEQVFETFATKEELNHANEQLLETAATKEDLTALGENIGGGATLFTDLKKAEDAYLHEESGNAALYAYCQKMDQQASWFLLDYGEFVAQAEENGGASTLLLHEKLKEIKSKFSGKNRPSVLLYTSVKKTPFFTTSAFKFVSGINYYYYSYSSTELPASVRIEGCSDINLHGFVLSGRDAAESALQLIRCTNIRVENCALENTLKGAVTLTNSKDILFADCALYGSGLSGMDEVTVTDNTENVTSITFRHCRFRNNGNLAVNASGAMNPNLSLVLDHVYYTDGSKISAKDCSSGQAKLRITALEEDLPTLATEEKDGLMSKEQSAFLSAFQQGQGRHRFAFGELGMYEEYPVNVQVEYVRTGLKCGLLNLVYRMPEIPETETRFGHVSIEKLNALMRSRFGFDFSISNRITGVWFASEKENLLQAGCGVGVYSNYIEPVTITTEGKNVGLSLKQTGGALFRLLNVFVNER